MMELARILTEKATAATATSTTRPTLVAHGVDISTWQHGGYQIPSFVITLTPDAARTLTSPTGGGAGPELYTWNGTTWVLIGYLANIATVTDVPATGYAEGFTNIALGTRLCVAGTKSGGTMTFSAAPVERMGSHV